MIRAFDARRPAVPAPRGAGAPLVPAAPAAPAATWGVDLLVRSAPTPAPWRQELAALQASVTDLMARLDALVAQPGAVAPVVPPAAPAVPAPVLPAPVAAEPAPAPPAPAPAAAPAAPGAGPTIAQGAQGEAVTRLQDRLRELGSDPGATDGAFGPLTDAAVRDFQARQGLAVDGVVGPATWGALGIVVDVPAGPPPGVAGEPIAGWRAKVSQHFGGRHPGLDIAVPTGTPIQAVKAGEVVYAQFNPGGYGNLAILRHDDGTFTMYAHQSALNCHVGQAVQPGQVIGAVGSTGNSTGPHLHFEVRRGGEVWSAPAIDAEAYLGGH